MFDFFSEFLCSISSIHSRNRSISCVLLIDKPSKNCSNSKNWRKYHIHQKKKLLKRNSITPSKTNAPISQSFLEVLKVAIEPD